jgi:glycosyltransferase involved in cell wall biosynthesis
MRLLQVTPSYKPAFGYGGTIVSVGLLCETLVTEGCPVLVITTTANGKTELPTHKQTPVLVNGVPVLYFPRWTKDHSHFSPALLRYLWQQVRQYDVVHIHSWWNLVAMLSVLVCLLRGVRPVLSPRGMLSNFTIKKGFKPLFHATFGKWLLSKTYLHATANQEREECLAFIPNWQNAVLPNILELPPLNGVSREDKTFHLLFLSRIHEKKGIDVLLKALPQLPFDWRLTIVGDGEPNYIEQLKKQAASLGLQSSNGTDVKRINWMGWVKPEDRFKVFEQANLFVLPSHNENFANVVIESLSVGTPVLVSQYVGLSDYVLEKKMGWVCDTTVKSLQAKLTEAYYQKAERHRITSNSSNQIRADFAPATLAAQYVNMYKKALKTA